MSKIKIIWKSNSPDKKQGYLRVSERLTDLDFDNVEGFELENIGYEYMPIERKDDSNLNIFREDEIISQLNTELHREIYKLVKIILNNISIQLSSIVETLDIIYSVHTIMSKFPSLNTYIEEQLEIIDQKKF